MPGDLASPAGKGAPEEFFFLGRGLPPPRDHHSSPESQGPRVFQGPPESDLPAGQGDQAIEATEWSLKGGTLVRARRIEARNDDDEAGAIKMAA
jgi:hypothetical protein